MTRPLATSRLFSPLSLALTTALIGALAAVSPAHAAQAPAVQLVQAGDADMSCAALTTEINQLAAGRAKAASRAATGRKLFGFASTALQVAAPVMTGGLIGGVIPLGGLGGGGFGGGGLMSSMLSQAASSAVQQGVMQAAMKGAVAAAPAAPAAETGDTSIEAQRIQRLTAMLQTKGC